MIFLVISEIRWKWNCCTKKRCVLQGACREMSSSAATAERREANASGLLLRMLCCAGVQPHLQNADLRAREEENGLLIMEWIRLGPILIY